MTVAVLDTLGARADPALPTLAFALDPARVQAELDRGLPRLDSGAHPPWLRAIRVTRHKPGRRCVIEYELELPGELVTLVGKIRARRPGRSSYRLCEHLWQAGFAADSSDGISVPEPIAHLPEFAMWLQRKVPGRLATDVLASEQGCALAPRIAEAAHKLHRAGVPTGRHHSMVDELRILRECFTAVAELRPELAERSWRLLGACGRLAASTPEPRSCGIHRDFYGDQVLVDDKGRLHLIDFDLYCRGDPALDIGNFLGHVTEHSLRKTGGPDTLSNREHAIAERYAQLAGATVAVANYATLTLARHVYLSTQRPGAPRQLTDGLLELCEQRLGQSGRPQSRAKDAHRVPSDDHGKLSISKERRRRGPS